MTFLNTIPTALGQIPEMEEMTSFEKVDNLKLIEIKAKLEVLEMLGGIVDSLREGLKYIYNIICLAGFILGVLPKYVR